MGDSSDFDADLAAALAASIEDHRQQHDELVLSSSFVAQRDSITRCDAAVVQGLEGKPRHGQLVQLNLFDQFHAVFTDIIKEHSAPKHQAAVHQMALDRVEYEEDHPEQESILDAFDEIEDADKMAELAKELAAHAEMAKEVVNMKKRQDKAQHPCY